MTHYKFMATVTYRDGSDRIYLVEVDAAVNCDAAPLAIRKVLSSGPVVAMMATYLLTGVTVRRVDGSL